MIGASLATFAIVAAGFGATAEQASASETLATSSNVSAAQVALNWVLSRPAVSTVILGARNEAQLRDNLAAASWRLAVEEIDRLDAASALPEPYPYWHQHKFGLERNPRVPRNRLDTWTSSVSKSREQAGLISHVRPTAS